MRSTFQTYQKLGFRSFSRYFLGILDYLQKTSEKSISRQLKGHKMTQKCHNPLKSQRFFARRLWEIRFFSGFREKVRPFWDFHCKLMNSKSWGVPTFRLFLAKPPSLEDFSFLKQEAKDRGYSERFSQQMILLIVRNVNIWGCSVSKMMGHVFLEDLKN